MRDLNGLSLFAAVVANGGFSAASRAVGMPKSRLSRQVAALEDQLGVRLLERSTRSVKVTAVGHEVYRHARAALDEAEAIDDTVSRLKAEPQGFVRVSIPPGIDRILGAALPAFLQEHPRLRLQMLITNRQTDLIDEGFDIAIRIRDQLRSDADFQVKILGETCALLVASPSFIAQHGAPVDPKDLQKYPTITLAERPGPERWSLIDKSGASFELAHEPKLSAGSVSIVRQAVLDGGGVAILPEFACAELLETGQLVRVLPEWSVPQEILHLVFTSRRGLLLGVRTVIDFLAETLNARSAAWRVACGHS